MILKNLCKKHEVKDRYVREAWSEGQMCNKHEVKDRHVRSMERGKDILFQKKR